MVVCLLVAVASGYVLSVIHSYQVLIRRFEPLSQNQYHALRMAPLEIERGRDLDAVQFIDRLRWLGYRRGLSSDVARNEYYTEPGCCYLGTSGLDGVTAQRVRLDLDGSVVRRVVDPAQGVLATAIRLQPDTLTCFEKSVWEIRFPRRYHELPDDLVKAVLSTEDEGFFDHPGVDARAIVRAMLRNLTAGRVVQGGSTITQQLVKILLERDQQTLRRKMDEALLALALERRYPKESILAVYLNSAYMGYLGPFEIRGMDAAAQVLLSSRLEELSLEEYALLAGLLRSPNSASPVRRPQAAAQRTSTVLWKLAQDGDPAARVARAGHAIHADLLDDNRDHLPYYLSQVETELARLRLPPSLEDDACQIDLGIDPWLQARLGSLLDTRLDELQHREGADADHRLEGAVVALDPRSGAILAAVGGRDYSVSQFNRAFLAQRQIGSLVKPFVYLGAMGGVGTRPQVTPLSLLADTPLTVRRGEEVWRPHNADRLHRGEVTVRDALVRSYNVPSVRLGLQLGIDPVVRLLRDVGLGPIVDRVPSVLLGSSSASPTQVAGAYAALANGGRAVSPSVISRIASADQPYWMSERQRPVAPPAACYVITDMLRGVLTEGTAARAKIGGLAGVAAGKTGTSSQLLDSWFVGYTEDLVVAVWVGHDDATPTGLSGASGALQVWQDVMVSWTGQGDATDFTIPAGVDHVSVDLESRCLATEACPTPRTLAFLSGTAPTQLCPLHEVSAVPVLAHVDSLLDVGRNEVVDVAQEASSWFEQAKNKTSEWLKSLR